MLRKVAMLLIAGLTLTMFTACGDDSSSTRDRSRVRAEREDRDDDDHDDNKDDNGGGIIDIEIDDEDSPEEELLGSWVMSYDMSESITAEMGEEFSDFESAFCMDLVFELDEDGSMTMYVDQESLEENLELWILDFSSYATEMIYEEAESMGVSREMQDQAICDTYGYETVYDYMLSEMTASITVDDLGLSKNVSGEYKVEGDKIYLAWEGEDFDSASYDNFEIEGDTLTFTADGMDDIEILPGLTYPLVFTRQ